MRVVPLLSVVMVAFLLSILADPVAGGKDNKKNDKKGDIDVVGVVVEVHRDSNPKDKDIGHIVVRTPKKNEVKITVLKSTDIIQNGKKVGFKALDKGDQVSVDTMKNMPRVAERIVIRKN